MTHVYTCNFDVLYFSGTLLHHTTIQSTDIKYVPYYLEMLYDVPEGNIVSIALISKTLSF